MKSRYVWVVVVLVATAGALVLLRTTGPEAKPADVRAQLETRMRTTLEKADPGQHNHAGHQGTTGASASAAPTAQPAVICGVRVYGYEPAEATKVADVKTLYGFHLCGVAEQKRPWDVAVKLAGPVILDVSREPPGIQVVEGTATVRFVDRLTEMFPPKYADLAQREALSDAEMADLRRRYDQAAGVTA